MSPIIRRVSGFLVSGILASGIAISPALADTADSAGVAVSMKTLVETLAAPDMDGRGPGSPGLEKAAGIIARRFREAGLKPALAPDQDPANAASWMQPFTPPAGQSSGDGHLAAGTKWGSVTLRNILGVLPGTGGPGAGCIVIGAHYDHLGVNEAGERFPGADDNASGVAIVTALAARLASNGPYRNTIIFAAFSGEEEGTLGSRHYVEHPACPLDRTVAMLNLDAVGRMEGKKLFVFGSGSAVEFASMLKGVNLGVGCELVTPEAGAFASDQIPFFEKGIPVLHFFSGPNADYHRPTDTADKINVAGMMKELDFIGECASFLAGREEKLTFVPPGAMKAPPAMAGAGGGTRRVSLGTIPDFSRESGGVLLSGTMPGSPAEAAGLMKGDVLIRLGDAPIDNLADFSAALKEHQPGDSVDVVFKRGDAEMHRRVRLVERK